MSDSHQTDHDLLIELRTEMRGVRGDIKDIKDGTASKLDDHEQRLRNLETNTNRWFGRQAAIAVFTSSAITIIAALIASGTLIHHP